MKITIQPTEQESIRSNYPEVSITIPNDDMLLAEVIETIIVPALVAWGFKAGEIKLYLGE